ncbi:Tab2/Atab2 family RNA-binding protein [Microcoleus sp. A2-C5]|uniref:Tab2/Atab2 family RNA-binding protein n=1 Tax=Microcoleaceae TaxID=1892252 RepID=UPI0022382C4D|nr:Tab2/Atab2 family RNA-binding protein [Lyngbya sp. CCAP 1446/10]MCW6052242.1 Tab2/Atab2 family RNA-binding protein [Lyngbya sp. CCAP 1446/10]
MATIWELDFYSRPILDEREKKKWEVLICESPLNVGDKAESLFRYSQFCPSTTVNSLWLAGAIKDAIASAPKPPEKIRFFRRQMANMITKACEELDIPVASSRRTLALSLWLEERMQDVYPAEPGYQPVVIQSVQFVPETPVALPDALIGEKWAFVSLPIAAFDEMSEWDIGFGEAFGLPMTRLAPETQIPGLIIYSSRATALAGWMSGLELAFLKFDTRELPRLVLDTGANDRWIIANLRDAATEKEAKGFEAAKKQAKQVHFLAIQSNPQSESFAGFWLLHELTI